MSPRKLCRKLLFPILKDQAVQFVLDCLLESKDLLYTAAEAWNHAPDSRCWWGIAFKRQLDEPKSWISICISIFGLHGAWNGRNHCWSLFSFQIDQQLTIKNTFAHI